ncbi:Ribosome maturation factor RimM [Nymphon striatum]|nr:Ribosome maturation factor RimM [Nymphon striatum]
MDRHDLCQFGVTAMSDLIPVGAIAGAYGVRGELRIKSYCAVPEDIEQYSPLFTEDRATQYALAILRPIKGGFVVRITDVSNKEEADCPARQPFCLQTRRANRRSGRKRIVADPPLGILPGSESAESEAG